jgi:hypothetical protein
MARLSQPCPFSNECHGTIHVHPEIETQYKCLSDDGIRYVTEVTVTCLLVAECNCCTFCEIAANDSQQFAFDQINYTIPSWMKRKIRTRIKNKKRRLKGG